MSDTMKQAKNKEKQAGLVAERQLPEPFADLAPYLAWSLPTDRERSAKRQSSTMEEINAFYHAMLPRMEEILSCLEQYPPEQCSSGSAEIILSHALVSQDCSCR